MAANEHPASFRDPSGFVFQKNGTIYRQVNPIYKENYDHLIKSGLFKKLANEGLLVQHKEIKGEFQNGAYKIIEPENIPFISYPYEWCFSQLKDAALLTLKIQRIALEFGMSLKDATSFNVQFKDGKPIFIDTLSFEILKEKEPWVAYKQFCEQFLAPLILISKKDIRLLKLTQIQNGGIDLDLAQKLLPVASKIKPGIFMHIFLHSKMQKKYSDTRVGTRKSTFTTKTHEALVDGLTTTVKYIKVHKQKTTWSHYYGEDMKSYIPASAKNKKEIVENYLKITRAKYVWDIGANTGLYSRSAAKPGTFVVSMDSDPETVENNYLKLKEEKVNNILPLWVDITNPTNPVGWDNQERESLLTRPHPDTSLALALIHHLAISANVPITKIAEFFSKITKNLIIEFVPKEDPKVQILLQNREDIFEKYDQKNFELEFLKYFDLIEKKQIKQSKRIIYLFKKKK